MHRVLPAFLLLPLLAIAASDVAEEVGFIEELRVQAVPLTSSSTKIVQPVIVLAGERLDRALAPTLGATLGREPGINTNYFGPAVGRPVIRGLGGARVRVLQDGLGVADASATSDDHAVAVEPFLADQIEVLKGAATVLYGSGAIGGVVNTVTGRIPATLPEADLSVRAQGSLGDVANEENAGIRVDGRAGRFAFLLGGHVRSSDQYEIPGFAESAAARQAEAAEAAEEHGEEEEGSHEEDDDHEHEEESFGLLSNSDLDVEALSFGAAWVGAQVTAGFAVSRYQAEYGLPGSSHEHEEDHDEEEHGEEEADDEAHEDDEEGGVRIDLDQTRYDFHVRYDEPFAWVTALRARGALVDYRHLEFEGTGEIGSRFGNEALEGRVELLNEPIRGFKGALGVHFEEREFSAVGEEAFVVPVDRRKLALFVFQERERGDLRFDVGARLEEVDYSPSEGRDRTFTVGSLSLGSLWSPRDDVTLGLQLDVASRAPALEELYANGAHIATQTFEIGNSGLGTEMAFNGNASFHGHFDAWDVQVNLFVTRFADFIYLADTNAEEEGLPERRWVQSDAIFHGGEASVRVPLLRDGPTLDLRFMGDLVRARLSNAPAGVEENLPRIPAARFGVALDFVVAQAAGEVSLMRVLRQDKTAAFESVTDAYTALDAYLGWHVDLAQSHLELYARGQNLLDVEQRLHASFLKDQAPLPGRAFEAGLRVAF